MDSKLKPYTMLYFSPRGFRFDNGEHGIGAESLEEAKQRLRPCSPDCKCVGWYPKST